MNYLNCSHLNKTDINKTKLFSLILINQVCPFLFPFLFIHIVSDNNNNKTTPITKTTTKIKTQADLLRPPPPSLSPKGSSYHPTGKTGSISSSIPNPESIGSSEKSCTRGRRSRKICRSWSTSKASLPFGLCRFIYLFF